MAEFCRKCAAELDFPPDLCIEALRIEKDTYIRVLCEGCGFIYIENNDGREIVYRATEWIDKGVF